VRAQLRQPLRQDSPWHDDEGAAHTDVRGNAHAATHDCLRHEGSGAPFATPCVASHGIRLLACCRGGCGVLRDPALRFNPVRRPGRAAQHQRDHVQRLAQPDLIREDAAARR
jgi:hypothetical protein